MPSGCWWCPRHQDRLVSNAASCECAVGFVRARVPHDRGPIETIINSRRVHAGPSSASVAALFALDDTVLTAWFTTGAAVVGRNRRTRASAYC